MAVTAPRMPLPKPGRGRPALETVSGGTGTRRAFVVPGNPVPWQRAGSGFGKRYTPLPTKLYQASVRAHAYQARVKPLLGPVRVSCIFHRETRHPCDLDNLLKTILDALQGIAYENDRQVVSVTAEKRIDAKHPRAFVEVSSVEDEVLLDVGGGIFGESA